MSTPTLSHRGVTYFRHTPGVSASQISRFFGAHPHLHCSPARAHGFAGNLPGYVHEGVHIATAVPHADICDLKHSKHVDYKD
jgi:hypothetical protein